MSASAAGGAAASVSRAASESVSRDASVEDASLFLPCAGGTEPLLADEVKRLTGRKPEAGRGGVWVAGDERTAMLLNLESRLAQRVLWPLIEGRYRDEHDLYDLARHVPWPAWIRPDQTLRVDVNAQQSPLRSLNFAALRIKDAVCDVLREHCGERPSVDTRHPTLPLVLYLGPERAMLYADTSGEALFKRGWRDARGGSQGVKGEAPLKETLAAAMLAAAGWQGRAEDGPLLDPFCGAGTIAIEAAQIACRIAPGAARSFAFERWQTFAPHQQAWRAMKQQARERVQPSPVAIHAGDVSFRLTDFAQSNAARAGVAQAISFKTADALQRMPPADAGHMVFNPPYGERIAPRGTGRVQRESGGAGQGARQQRESHASREAFADGADSAAFFSALATHWKRHYAGWSAWCLSPEMKLPSLMRLKESRRVPLWNGAIECRLFRFDIVAGSARD